MKYLNNTYKWLTATRLRRILASILALLIVLTSIRYLFLKPKEVKAADVYLSMDEGYGTSGAVNDANGAISAGSITGATWKQEEFCKSGKCLYFDGDEDYVSFADDPDLDFTATDSFTVMGWFRHAAMSGTAVDDLVAKFVTGDGGDGGYQISINTDGTLFCRIDDDDADDNSDEIITTTPRFDDNKWHHFACIKNGTSSLTLFVDGNQEVTATSFTITTLANNDPLTIGLRAPAGNQDYTGFIDEVKILRSVRTASQLKTDYLGATQSTSGHGPVGYWKLDEAGDATRPDSSGNANDLTETASDTVAQVTGKYDYAADFESGDTEWLAIADGSQTGLDGMSAFTFSAWINPESDPGISAPGPIITKSGTNGNVSYEFSMNNNQNISITWADIGFYSCASMSTDNFTIPLSTWTHVAATYDGTTSVIYINGTVAATESNPGCPVYNSNVDFSIGGGNINSTDRYFDGLIDEAKVYNYSRSQTQILEDMMNNPPPGTSASFGPDQSYLSNGLAGYWKLDESASPAVDFSGNGYSGTWAGNAASGPGKYGNAITLDGTGDYIDSGSNYNFDADPGFTISAWVYTNNAATRQTIYNNGAGTVLDLSGGAGSNKIEFSVRDTPGWQNLDSPTSLSSSTWYHIVAVHTENGRARIYINGTLDVESSSNFIYEHSGGTDDFIGRCVSGTCGANYDWNGKIDGVRVYRRSLTTSEVQKLYNWAPGPVAYWKMDENTGNNMYDASTNGNTGTLNNSPSRIAGKFGSAIGFNDSQTQTITVSDNDVLDMDKGLTISAWVRRNTSGLSEWETVFDKYGTGWEYWFGFNASYFVFMYNPGDESDADRIYVGGGQAALSLTDTNNWHYITATYDGSYVKMYIDGVFKFQEAHTDDIYDGTGGIKFSETTATDFKGSVDEVTIYNYPRSSSQIIEDMNAGHPAPGSPVGSAVANWEFDEGYGDTAYNSGTGGTGYNGDLAHNNDTCPSAGVDCPTWSNSGKFGKALSFDSFNDKVTSSVVTTATDNVAVSMWLNWGGTDSSNQEIFLNGVASSNGWLLRVKNTDNNELELNCESVGTVSTNTQLTQGVWNHVVAQRKNGTWEIYVDGKPIALTGSTTCTPNTPTTATVIGNNETGGGINQGFYGLIDEVRIYDTALSQQEISLLYNQGSMAVMGATSTDSSGNPTWSAENEYCPPGQGSTCTPPIAEWKLDEKSGTTVNDTSTNGNAGTITTNSWGHGKFGGGFKGDSSASKWVCSGSGSCADDDDFDFGTGSFSISIWYKSHSATNPGAQQILLSKNNVSNPGYMIDMNSNGKISFNTDDDTSFGPEDSVGNIAGAVDTNDGNWHHLEAVKNGTTSISIYTDGVLTETKTGLTATGSLSNALSLCVGSRTCSSGGSDEFEGAIDNVRIYNYARSASQVNWDFNQGEPVAHWQMDETSWNGTANEVKDLSGKALHGVRVGNATTTTGKINNAGTFDGTGDYVSVSANSVFNITSDITLAAWIKRSDPARYEAVISKDNGSLWDYDMYFCSGSGACTGKQYRLLFYSDAISPVEVSTANATVTDTNWHHVAITRSGSTFIFYIDGVNKGTASATGSFNQTSTGIKVGSDGVSFSGLIDDARIYNYALTPQQVKLIMNDGGALRFSQ